MPTHRLRTAKEIAITSVAEQEKQDRAYGAILKHGSTQGQLWTQDRAFKLRLESGKERGFTDMGDYVSKSQKYYAFITEKRRAGDAKAGERKSKKYAVRGFLLRTIPVFAIIGAVFFFPALIKAIQAFFYDRTTIHVFSGIGATHTPGPTAVAGTAIAVQHIATAQAYETAHPIATPVLTAVAGEVASTVGVSDSTLAVIAIVGVSLAIATAYLILTRGSHNAKRPSVFSRLGFLFLNRRNHTSGDSDSGDNGSGLVATVANDNRLHWRESEATETPTTDVEIRGLDDGGMGAALMYVADETTAPLDARVSLTGVHNEETTTDPTGGAITGPGIASTDDRSDVQSTNGARIRAKALPRPGILRPSARPLRLPDTGESEPILRNGSSGD